MYVSIDLPAQELEVWRSSRGRERPLIERAPGSRWSAMSRSGGARRLSWPRCARVARPGVPGDAGRRALALATRVARAIDEAGPSS